MKWLRLYSCVLHDPKVQRLSPALFKHWINLLCLANENETRGELPAEIDDIAFALRIKPSEAQQIITQLERAGLVDRTPEGRRSPHNWPQRQRQSDDVGQRVTRHRERKAAIKPNSDAAGNTGVTLQGTLPVTPRNWSRAKDTDSDTDSENTLTGEDAADAAAADAATSSASVSRPDGGEPTATTGVPSEPSPPLPDSTPPTQESPGAALARLPPRRPREAELVYCERIMREAENGAQRTHFLAVLAEQKLGVPPTPESHARLGKLAKDRKGAGRLAGDMLAVTSHHIADDPLDYLTKYVHEQIRREGKTTNGTRRPAEPADTQRTDYAKYDKRAEMGRPSKRAQPAAAGAPALASDPRGHVSRGADTPF